MELLETFCPATNLSLTLNRINYCSGKYDDALTKLRAGLDQISGTSFTARAVAPFRWSERAAKDRVFACFDSVRSTADPHTQFLF